MCAVVNFFSSTQISTNYAIQFLDISAHYLYKHKSKNIPNYLKTCFRIISHGRQSCAYQLEYAAHAPKKHGKSSFLDII